jgi:hypothetical protein
MPAGGQGKGQPAGFQLHRFLSEHSPQGFQFIGEAKVVVADILGNEEEAVAAHIRAGGGEAIAATIDVTSEPAWVELIAKTLASYGRLDVLVNNAGISGSSVGDPDGLEISAFSLTRARETKKPLYPGDEDEPAMTLDKVQCSAVQYTAKAHTPPGAGMAPPAAGRLNLQHLQISLCASVLKRRLNDLCSERCSYSCADNEAAG